MTATRTGRMSIIHPTRVRWAAIGSLCLLADTLRAKHLAGRAASIFDSSRRGAAVPTMWSWENLAVRQSAALRRRSPTIMATAFVAAGHLILLMLILSWRSPPVLPGSEAVDVSIFRSNGAVSSAPSQQAVTTPSENPHVAQPSKTVSAADSPQPLVELKIQPPFDPPKLLDPILVNVTLGGGVPDTRVAPATATPSSTVSPSASAGAGATTKTCQIFELLEAALQTSEQVRKALSLIPARSKSVANAVLLWDGHWVDANIVGGAAALNPIQDAVAQSISVSPMSCQEELVRGPRIVVVGDARDATVLAFGSGEWRWADVLPATPQQQISK